MTSQIKLYNLLYPTKRRGEIETEKSTFWSVWYIIYSFAPSLTLCSWRTCNPDLQSNPIVVKSRKTLFSPVNTPPPMRSVFDGKIQRGEKETEQEVL